MDTYEFDQTVAPEVPVPPTSQDNPLKKLDQDAVEYVMQMAYGDIPIVELRKTQKEREENLFRGTDVGDVFSDSLPHPDRCLLIGLNDNGQALAILALDEQESDAKGPFRTEEQIQEYSQVNPCFNFKKHYVEWERKAYEIYLDRQIKGVKTEEEADMLLKIVNIMSKADAELRKVISRAGPRITALVKGTYEDGQKKRELVEPTITFQISTYIAKETLKNPQWTETDPSRIRFRLFMCKPPTKNQRKTPGWKDIDIGISTANNMLPIACFNNTHILVVYSPPEETASAALFADLYLIESRKKVDRFIFEFPAKNRNGDRGFVRATLSKFGIAVLTFCNMAVVFDTQKKIEEPRIISTSAGNLTYASVFHPQNVIERRSEDDSWTGTLTMGTSRGEVLSMCWKTGTIFFIDYVHTQEPVLGMQYSNGKLLLHTINDLWLLPTMYQDILFRTTMSASRPLAIGMIGTLIPILSKYGHVHVYSALHRGALRTFEPPQVHCRASMIQPCYDGMRTTYNSMIVLYPDGKIRGIYF